MTTPDQNRRLWAYVVIFDGVTVDEFTKVVNRYDDKVRNWMSVLPQTVFLVSPLVATNLTDFLREKMPRIGRLLVLDAKTDRNGWLPQNAWDFLRNPAPPKK